MNCTKGLLKTGKISSQEVAYKESEMGYIMILQNNLYARKPEKYCDQTPALLQSGSQHWLNTNIRKSFKDTDQPNIMKRKGLLRLNACFCLERATNERILHWTGHNFTADLKATERLICNGDIIHTFETYITESLQLVKATGLPVENNFTCFASCVCNLLIWSSFPCTVPISSWYFLCKELSESPVFKLASFIFCSITLICDDNQREIKKTQNKANEGATCLVVRH